MISPEGLGWVPFLFMMSCMGQPSAMHRSQKTIPQNPTSASVDLNTEKYGSPEKDGDALASNPQAQEMPIALTNSNPAVPTPDLAVQTLANGIYQIRSGFNGKCLDVPDGIPTLGLGLEVEDCTGSAFQKFVVELVGEGYYRITNVSNGRALQIREPAASGSILEQTVYSAKSSQQFALELEKDGKNYRIRVRGGNLVIQSKDDWNADKTTLEVAPSSASEGQHWLISPAIQNQAQ